ncbi:cation:proton antiporter domain-containing protein, partial [Rhodocyclus tenuis]|uniref:cation:proton antiporter domain-containing protein n=1 Tax=Rhodocyclus tenuis TaxID=1066 RepID=UPI001291F899
NYAKILGLFLLAFLLNSVAPEILHHLDHFEGTEAAIASALWCIGLFLVFGWACSKAAEGTIFPNFTLQLLVGIVLHDALSPIAAQVMIPVVVCTALAAIILKGGGDEVERRDFLKIAFPTVMIALVGYLITFFAMFPLLMLLGLDGKTAALLAAIIGSTDPAALIPTLKNLVFKPEYKRVGDIAVAESALNDAVGAIFTGAVAAMILAGASVDSLTALAGGLFSADNMLLLGKQFAFGTVAGLIGWGAMVGYERYKSRDAEHDVGETAYDFALVLAIPLLTFLLAQAIHGNGFLAAFVAGLLANYNHGKEYFHSTLRTMEVKIESVAKPTIFMMVGPFVALGDLWQTALLGLVVSLAFILVARPLAVMLSMLPTKVTLKERLFLSVVRETGVIPVVLAVITVAQFPELKLLMPLTAWVVIWTLTLL